MNEERLIKIIEDMTEVIKNLKACKEVLETNEEGNTTIFIEFGLKQIFVDFFITVEDLTSIILKEIKESKIGIDMKVALGILKSKKVIEDDIYLFLNEAMLLRNRISHRYKEPSRGELLDFVNCNTNNFDKVLEIAKKYLSKGEYGI